MRTAIAALLMVFAMPAWAQNWVRYGVDAAGRTLYYEPSTIQVIGWHTRVWQLYDHPRGPSQVLLTEFDCKESRTRYLASETYHERMGKGAAFSSETFSSGAQSFRWQFIPPGDPYVVLLKLVCRWK
jgi:hypothetical protein